MRGKKASITAPVENQLLLVPKDTNNNRRASVDKKVNLMTGLEDSYISGDEYEKSFPRMAFQSIRGKKAPSGDEYYKRAPMGFQGMRGKKSVEEVSSVGIVISLLGQSQLTFHRFATVEYNKSHK